MSELLLDASKRVDAHMQLHYRTKLNDMEITDTPGYWRDKKPKAHRGHPIHSCIGCEGPFKATYTYFDYPRDSHGRFTNITKTWRIIKDNS